MKNNDISTIINKVLIGIKEEKSLDELADDVYDSLSAYDIESLIKPSIKGKIKAKIKDSEPGVFIGQSELFNEYDELLPFKTENGKTIQFGNTSGKDLVAAGDRKLKHLNDAHARYDMYHKKSMPLITEALSKNITTWEAVTNLDLIGDDKEKQA